MKGKILGIDAIDGSGAITGETGSRYRFTQNDWRGERPPAIGMTVDFDADDGLANDVYPAIGASPGSLDLSGLSAVLSTPPAGGQIGHLFTQSLALPLALIGMIACFLPAISSPQQDYSLIGLGEALNSVAMPTGMAAALLGGAQDADLGTIKTLVILRFAAPLTALWLAWTAWRGKSERLPLLVAGGASLMGATLVFMTESAVLSAVPEMLRPQIEALISVGMGAWLLILAGGAMIAAGLGVIRNPLAKA